MNKSHIADDHNFRIELPQSTTHRNSRDPPINLHEQYLSEDIIRKFPEKRLMTPFSQDDRNPFDNDRLVVNGVAKHNSSSHRSFDQDKFHSVEKMPSEYPIQRYGSLQRVSMYSGINNFDEERQGFSNSVWQKHSLRILHYIIKFITIILKSSEKYKFTFITQQQFEVIDDSTASYQFYLENNLIRQKYKVTLLTQLVNKMSRLRVVFLIKVLLEYVFTKVIKVIKPDSPLKYAWDAILLLILSVNFFYVPFKVGFQLDVSLDNGALIYFTLEIIPGYILLLDIMMNFNTGYYSHGILNINKQSIAKKYIKESLVSDLLIVVPFFLVKIQLYHIPYLDLIVLFRFRKAVNIMESLEENLNLREKRAYEIDVFKLLILFLFISHLCACSWHLLGSIEPFYGYEPTWIDNAGLKHSSIASRYISSIYWSSITTLTIGYGDIVPQTDLERLFVIFVAIISSVVFGYTISSIGAIFSQISKVQNLRRDQVSQIVSFINNRGVSTDLKNRVKKFSQVYFEVDQNNDCDRMIGHLASDLKLAVRIELYEKLIRTSFLFRDNFSSQIISDLCQVVKEKVYVPGEQVFGRGQRLLQLSFITKGQIDISVQSTSMHFVFRDGSQVHVIGQLKKGKVLGERCFISGEQSEYSAHSNKFTSIAYITFDDFTKLLEKHPEDHQKYFELRDKARQREPIKFIGCELCKENHTLRGCQFTFYNPRIRKVVKRHYQSYQQRQEFVRNRSRIHLPLMFKRVIQEGALAYGLDNGIYHEDEINEYFIRKYDCEFLNEIMREPLHQDTLADRLNQDLGNIQEESSSISRQSSHMSKRVRINLKLKQLNQSVDVEEGYVKSSLSKLDEMELTCQKPSSKEMIVPKFIARMHHPGMLLQENEQEQHAPEPQSPLQKRFSNRIIEDQKMMSSQRLNFSQDLNHFNINAIGQLDSNKQAKAKEKMVKPRSILSLPNFSNTYAPEDMASILMHDYLNIFNDEDDAQHPFDRKFEYQNYYPQQNPSNVINIVRESQAKNGIKGSKKINFNKLKIMGSRQNIYSFKSKDVLRSEKAIL